MRWIKYGWVALLAIGYLWFAAWYGGNGKPITPEEGERLLQNLQAIHATQTGEGNFVANVKEMIPNDDGKEFYAVNLEKLKPGEKAREADAAYTKIVFPLLFKRAGHPVFVSDRAGLMLGDYGNDVDRVAVVRYRSLRDMIKMASEPAMADGSDYKFAALEHTEVFITRPVITFVQISLMLGLLIIFLMFGGWKLSHVLEKRFGDA